jgi:hypothetical protein
VAVVNIESIKQQLQSIERQKRALEEQMAQFQQQKLTALPHQVGLSSVDGLIVALIPHASSSMRAKLQAVGIDQMATAKGVSRSAEKKMHFSPELKARVKRELQEGSKTVATLSREYGPSHSTIMGWKREWGMTRPQASPSSPFTKLHST